MDSFDAIVVGAGFAGCTLAERLASAGRSVLLLDQRNHLGGNAYDEYDEHGVLVHRYGPHIFHTNSQQVFDYLSRFTDWRPYVHHVRAVLDDGRVVPVPINRTTLAAFNGDIDAAREAIIRPYSLKQWGCDPEQLDRSVLARVAARADSDDARYFCDAYQAMPLHGFTRMFRRMVDSPRIKVLLQASFHDVFPMLLRGDIFYTGPIDGFFQFRLGRLPYRSARFEYETHRAFLAQPVAVMNYPSLRHAFTRKTEFKRITGQDHPFTTIATEFPEPTGDPFWPVPTDASARLYRAYRELADTVAPHVRFLGRLGSYRYLNMDQVVAQALTVARAVLAKESTCLQV